MDELEQKAYIFGTIFTLSNKLQAIGDKFDKNITIKQWLLLVTVSKFQEPPTISEAANYVGYSRQNAKRMAAALEERGFVTITKDKNDARALRIALTPKCQEYFAGREQRELEFLKELFLGFDAELTAGFYQGLTKLENNIETMMDHDANDTEELS
ncbi:MAG TPA: MarR family transcriptional regulator [Syntrophomonadaceae bacterium]|jgi:DNA-binding MarR family transcriptional regulator|nr:MarR family transcriptional regulator [Syntrophomonadaceae bacterium]HRX21395.1 MarR family transcriptional regulator [Syntrophomonadaceae bacterium]